MSKKKASGMVNGVNVTRPPIELEKTAASRAGMTLDEMAAFVATARVHGIPGSTVLHAQNTGWKMTIKNVKVVGLPEQPPTAEAPTQANPVVRHGLPDDWEGAPEP